ncbi:MAG: porin family protein [Dysgonamonadaceae bacterium]|nr:porin family protein [Dysgonamonadaceae bacterium]
MKKYVVFMGLFLLMGGISVQAQLKFGLKAGVNLSNISLEGPLADNLAISNLTGFKAGPMMELTIPIIGLGLEAAVLYSQQDFKFSKDELRNKNYKRNGLEVPVNLKYKLSFFKLIGIYGTAGPYIHFKLSENLQNQFNAQTFGAGLNFGAGVELLSHLQAGINYQMGLTEDYSANDFAGNLLKGKTTTWSITAAYLF